MPRFYDGYNPAKDGELSLVNRKSEWVVDVFYTPSISNRNLARRERGKEPTYPVKIMELDYEKNWITTLPIITRANSPKFLSRKYKKIERISFANAKPVLSHPTSDGSSEHQFNRSLTLGKTKPVEREVDSDQVSDYVDSTDEIMLILENLPTCFVKDYDYGLGFTRPYRFIVGAVEQISDCNHIVISKSSTTGIDRTKRMFSISWDDFETARKNLDNITKLSSNATSSIKAIKMRNFLGSKVGLSDEPLNFGRHPIRTVLTTFIQEGGKTLTEEDKDQAIEVVSSNAQSIAQTNKERLVVLKKDIEIATLDVLIEEYSQMLYKKKNDESLWHDFLSANPFSLSMVFGYPIVKIRDNVTVGGMKVAGIGQKIADVLVRNSLTNNIAIIEIKKPGTRLLNKTQYRLGLFSPSSDLAGAVNQVLDQKFQLERTIDQLKSNSQEYELESYAIHCCVIAGELPDERDRQKSFELFRKNSANVNVVTFDELLESLKMLRQFLKGKVNIRRDHAPPFDPPF